MHRNLSRAPVRVWLLPALAVAANQLAYYGGSAIARGRLHFCLETAADRRVPVLPWTVCVYLLCFLFWAAAYLWAARQEKAMAYRFFCADFLAKAICFACFVLLPTTNLRPALEPDGLWTWLLALVYRLDAPTNLFPSIHCMVSWLCFIGVRADGRLPLPVRAAACLGALAVCLSTLTTRQHVLADVLGGVLLAELAWRWAGFGRVARQYSRVMDTLLIRQGA